MFDKDLTIINKYNGGYVKNTVKGFYNSNQGMSINGVDLIKSDGYSVRILMSEVGYVKPNDYVGVGWTLRPDDYIVKGIVTETSIDSITTIQDNYECMKITSVHVNDYGSLDMQHFKVIGQ